MVRSGQQPTKTLIIFFYLISEEDKREDNEDPDIAKIKKVQSFFRGWLCRYSMGGWWRCKMMRSKKYNPRRRWKQIVENYIKSPHAESMRKRNW